MRLQLGAILDMDLQHDQLVSRWEFQFEIGSFLSFGFLGIGGTLHSYDIDRLVPAYEAGGFSSDKLVSATTELDFVPRF